MKLVVCDSVDAVADEAAAFVAAAVVSHPDLVVGLPTGRTPLGLYSRLRHRALDWSRVRTFNMDEFAGVAPDDARSFRAFMHEHLFGALHLRPEQMGFLSGTAADLEEECTRYDRAMSDIGGLDLLVSGIGANGHVAFNEPGPLLRAPTHIATLHASTRLANAALFGGDVAAVPVRALTIGMAAILQARRVLVIATGAAKAHAVAAMVRGPLTTMAPASWLQVHPAVKVILDRAAASALGEV